MNKGKPKGDADGKGRTRAIFRQRFKVKEEFEQAKPYCIEGNEQNLDAV